MQIAILNSEGAVSGRPQQFRMPKCDLVYRHRNPGATEDLVIPVTLVCNVADDILTNNVKANSKLDRKWLGTHAPHDMPAIMCGSGPSLKDDLGLIDDLHAKGGKIFALNGAASFLVSKGIYPDYQVIVDARPQTATLIGPARRHLFASQVDPSLFEKEPNAEVVHVLCVKQDAFFDLLPDQGHRDGEYTLIGSHGSVGNVAMVVAHTLGHRELHFFGYDSSNAGEDTHAFSQPMNAGEPLTYVEYNGKRYLSTFTMKSQADVFPRVAYDLMEMGSSIHMHGYGLLPDRWRTEQAKTLEQREADKYRAMWNHAEYRDMSPGMLNAERGGEALGVMAGDTLLDFGCGTGRATNFFRSRGVDAIGIDLAPNALEFLIPFVEACLWQLPDLKAHWGLCCDVMEHIPPEKVSDVLAGIASRVERGAYFTIDSGPDEMGVLIGQPLHMTMRPPKWWDEQLKKHFAHVDHFEGGVFVCRHKKGLHQ